MEHFRQEDIDELFTDLKVIGSIRQHQRISTCGPHIRIDDTGVLQPVRRAWLGEDRESNLRGVKRAMQTANALIDLSLTPPSTPIKRSFLGRIQVELENTIRGLKNLQTTYEGDITICSKLDVHIENITNKFNSIREFIASQASSPIAIPSTAPSVCCGDTSVAASPAEAGVMIMGSADSAPPTTFGTPTNAPTLNNYLSRQSPGASSSVSSTHRSEA